MGALLLLAPAALAEEPAPEAPEAVAVEEIEESLELEDTATYSEGWRWVSPNMGAVGTGDVVGLAIPRAGSSFVFALLSNGSVWRSLDSGSSWMQVLAGFNPEPELDVGAEEILLEAESLIEDLSGIDAGDTELPDDLDSDVEEELADGSLMGVDLLEVDAMIAPEEGEGSAPMSLWIHPRFADLLMVSRQDGLWRSGDAGESFDQVEPNLRISSFGTGDDALILGGGEHGLLYSVDGGRHWIDRDEELDDYRVTDISNLGGVWWIATDEGMLSSSDGDNWRPSPLNEPVMAISRGVPSVKLAATSNALYLFDNRGVRRAARQALPETGRIIALPRPGHVVVAGGDGVWESVDGGTRWRPVSEGLYSPMVNDLVQSQGGLLAATPEGLRLLQHQPEGIRRAEIEPPEQMGAPLNLLVAVALSREGMDPRDSGAGSVFSSVRRILPTFTIDAQYVDRNNLSADYFDFTNSATLQDDWRLMAHFTWGAGSSDSTDAEIAPLSDLFYVIGETVYSSTDMDGLTSVASRLLVDATSYRVQVENNLSEIYFARKRLLSAPPPDPEIDLREAVLHLLDVQELTARIDAYTNNALTSSL